MQEATRHLLDGVIGLTCVDPGLNTAVATAPLVVNVIAQQSLFACHAASAAHALLQDGDSSLWYIMRHVAQARERYTAVHAPPPPPPIPSRRAECNVELRDLLTGVSRNNSGAVTALARPQTVSSVSHTPPPSTSHTPALTSASESTTTPPIAVLAPTLAQTSSSGTPLMLSPWDFRVVVVGGGRVGRAIVEQLLLAPHIIHPSRITIITRQTESVAQFAGRGVQCTGRREGRNALLECHVLIIACQQTQFYDFASIYCPRRSVKQGPPPSSRTSSSKTHQTESSISHSQETQRRRPRRRQQKKKTLRDVVNKWRTTDDDDYDNGSNNYDNGSTVNGVSNPSMTRLLKPGTFVFSCCAALGTHKIAKELGHFDPLVIRAEVDFAGVHAGAEQFNTDKDAFRSDFIRRIALEGNSFLSSLNALQQSYMAGESPFVEVNSISAGDLFSCEAQIRVHRRRKYVPPPDIQDTMRGEGVSGTTPFLLKMWHALCCFIVVKLSAFPPGQQRLFTYLQRVGPLLGAALVALPGDLQARVVAKLTELLDRDVDEIYETEEDPLIKLDQRIVAAYDSDSDPDNVVNAIATGTGTTTATATANPQSPPDVAGMRELTRLVKCFPELFSDETDVLQRLREHYLAVTELKGV
ncbi:uncharacterized protein TM35_000291300 [Trypanosoma theileri]|uniref:Pyrroline-5-carboxylate reductase catalytic N-terminal domain-containing protein n=1 Tax=Trypanosoma theileri TaxID=67003 RepID=A0A1X0NP07_9TRYP|nr:uncharacterized protein TM35_000291300 [Trypanosoma theileri]ORC86248.1 hypothetical protein TM35_000291300 [Trypanosoma theileri]